MAAPKTKTETAFVFSCAGPVAAHDAARKVIPIVSPDVTEHSLKVHLAPLRPPTADRYIIVRTHPAAAPTVSVMIPTRNEAENLPHVFATVPQWIQEVALEDVPSHQRSRMHGASNFSAVRCGLRGLRGLRTIFPEPRRPVVIREHTPATTRSANQGAA